MSKKTSHSKNQRQHVIPLGKGWAVKEEKSSDFFIITTKQSEAIVVARKLAQNTSGELVVHSRDGRIRDVESYAKK